MIKKTPPLLIIATIAVLALVGPQAAGDEIRSQWTGVDRIVVIGDVHGAYDNLVSVLKKTGLVNKKLKWIGGKNHLVQVGDLVDRGPDSRKAMDLLMNLEKQADSAGGKIHVLIGNHEGMNMIGILDHTSPEELASYVDRDSKRRRDQIFKSTYKKEKDAAKARGEEPPDETKARNEFEDKVPLGYIEHRLAFKPDGEYGKWVLSRNASILVNGILFSHADWNQEMAALGIEEFNRRVRMELGGQASLEEGVAFELESPLQYRGFSKASLDPASQKLQQEELNQILETLGAKRIVVGHTVARTGTIEVRFQGKHLSVDTGMLELYGGGHQIALEIEGNQFYAIHPEGKVPLPNSTEPTVLADYFEAVAKADPTNVGVRVALVDRYRILGDLDDARRSFEELFRPPRTIPESYEKALCTIYRHISTPETQPVSWVAEHCH